MRALGGTWSQAQVSTGFTNSTMPKHSFNKRKFKVKIQYRPGKTRGVIALPAPVLFLLNNCEYIDVEITQDGQITLSENKDDVISFSRDLENAS